MMTTSNRRLVGFKFRFPGNNLDLMTKTLKLIGHAIRKGSQYPPIRNHAAKLASTAAPKDYVGQVKAIWNDFLKRWRYVKDPVSIEMLTYSPVAIWRLILAGDGKGVGAGRGAGDCDCATIAMGSLLESVGFPVRIGTTSPASSMPGPYFKHVFIQANIPKVGWVTVDPVLHPTRGLGDTSPHSRIAFWNLDGQLLGYHGNLTSGPALKLKEKGQSMFGNVEQWQDQGLYGFAGDEGEEPSDWSQVGLRNWGAYTPTMGIIDGGSTALPMVEVNEDDAIYGYDGEVRTPMLELHPSDYGYVKIMGRPYPGMMALGDDGQEYMYDGLSGFFKKLFKRVKRGVKKVARRIKKGVRKVLKKTRFGRFLLKIGAKIKKVAMKIVKPLLKFVGKYASKLAPVAALIPGFGPAVAAGMYAAGKIAKLMTKHGVKLKGKKGKVRDLAVKNKKQLKGFQKDLAKEARKMSKKGEYLAKIKKRARRR